MHRLRLKPVKRTVQLVLLHCLENRLRAMYRVEYVYSGTNAFPKDTTPIKKSVLNRELPSHSAVTCTFSVNLGPYSSDLTGEVSLFERAPLQGAPN